MSGDDILDDIDDAIDDWEDWGDAARWSPERVDRPEFTLSQWQLRSQPVELAPDTVPHVLDPDDPALEQGGHNIVIDTEWLAAFYASGAETATAMRQLGAALAQLGASIGSMREATRAAMAAEQDAIVARLLAPALRRRVDPQIFYATTTGEWAEIGYHGIVRPDGTMITNARVSWRGSRFDHVVFDEASHWNALNPEVAEDLPLGDFARVYLGPVGTPPPTSVDMPMAMWSEPLIRPRPVLPAALWDACVVETESAHPARTSRAQRRAQRSGGVHAQQSPYGPADRVLGRRAR